MKLPAWLLNNSWMNDVNVIAQFAHAGIPYGVLLTSDHYHLPGFWWVAVGILAYATVKEFWYDANYEIPKQPLVNNVVDFSFYCFGVGLACVVHQ